MSGGELFWGMMILGGGGGVAAAAKITSRRIRPPSGVSSRLESTSIASSPSSVLAAWRASSIVCTK